MNDDWQWFCTEIDHAIGWLEEAQSTLQAMRDDAPISAAWHQELDLAVTRCIGAQKAVQQIRAPLAAIIEGLQQ